MDEKRSIDLRYLLSVQMILRQGVSGKLVLGESSVADGGLSAAFRRSKQTWACRLDEIRNHTEESRPGLR